jgi:hypothetical protein
MKYGQSYSFQYIGQTPRSTSQGHICKYPREGLVSRKTHVKYQSNVTFFSKDTAGVKVFGK